MNKERFLVLLKDSARVSSELDSLVALAKEYPYSQPLRAMVAKASKTDNKKQYQNRITMAAVYAADRTVLKEFIEKGSAVADKERKPASVPPRKSAKPPAQKTEQKRQSEKKSTPAVALKPKQVSTVKKAPTARPATVDNIAVLREEVLHNLQELIKNKQALNDIFAAAPPNPGVKASAKTMVKEKVAPKPRATKQATKSKVKTTTKAQKKSKVQSETVKEELISKFIAASPSITPNKKFSGSQEDLSLASVEFNEDLFSENLAEIFARQGKLKKAIEIYRKLIWKFPQKKAFFATRIEEIKAK